MDTESTAPSLDAAKQYIDAIDFSQIIDKMVMHQGWLRKEAEIVCDMYRKFLFLNKKYYLQNILDTKNIENTVKLFFMSIFYKELIAIRLKRHG